MQPFLRADTSRNDYIASGSKQQSALPDSALLGTKTIKPATSPTETPVFVSTFSFHFRFPLSVSIFSFSFQFPLSAFSFHFQFPFPVSTFSFHFQFLLSASTFSFHLHLTALSNNFVVTIPGAKSKAAFWEPEAATYGPLLLFGLTLALAFSIAQEKKNTTTHTIGHGQHPYLILPILCCNNLIPLPPNALRPNLPKP